MKKILYLASLLLSTVLVTSCEKEEIGETATMNMAGEWYVTVDAADESGNLVPGFEDLFGLGRHLLLTYNTASNSPSEMIIDDLGTFWEYRVKASCDQSSLTFQTNTTSDNNLVDGYDINVTVTGGKILPGAGRQNNGSPADSIVFYVSFSDDAYPAAYGFKNYRVSGIRYSGLAEND